MLICKLSIAQVVDPDTKLRDPSLISFPNQDHEATRPLKEGILERKTRFKKNYIEVGVFPWAQVYAPSSEEQRFSHVFLSTVTVLLCAYTGWIPSRVSCCWYGIQA